MKVGIQFSRYKQVPEGYLAFVEELPGANTQGATLDEAVPGGCGHGHGRTVCWPKKTAASLSSGNPCASRHERADLQVFEDPRL